MQYAFRFLTDALWAWHHLRPRTWRRATEHARQCREDLRFVPVTWSEFWGVFWAGHSGWGRRLKKGPRQD